MMTFILPSPQLSSTTPCPVLQHALQYAVPRRRTHSPQDQARAVQPTAARAQQAARLLGELRMLMRQRRGNALLGRCLRLGARHSACLVHLGQIC